MEKITVKRGSRQAYGARITRTLGMAKITVKHGSRLVCRARIAKTLAELGLGLSGTEKMGKDEGLLLAFPAEGRWMNGIWMAGMRFPIDLVFLGKDRRIVGIEKNLKPLTLDPGTWKVYIPKKSAKYALEMNAERAKGLKEGDLLEFHPQDRQPF